MKVCVIGREEFICGALISRLIADGADVKDLRDNFTDLEQVAEAVDGAEVVFYLPIRIDGILTPTHSTRPYLIETHNVIRACLRKSVPHIVFLSSIIVCGPANAGKTVNGYTEVDHSVSERGKRVESLIEAESHATEMGRKTSLAVTILRAGNIFGPGKELPKAPFELHVGRTAFVFGRRDRHFPVTYVQNFIDAIVLAGRRTNGGLKRYLVIDDDSLTLEHYLSARNQIIPGRTCYLPAWMMFLAAGCWWLIVSLATRGFGSSTWWRKVRTNSANLSYDSREILNELGWRPGVSIKEGIKATVEAASLDF